jgi:hypothetical protein
MKKARLLESAHADASDKQRRPESCEITEKSDNCDIVYYGYEIKTVEQLLESQGIDMAILEIVTKTINNWEVTGKRSLGQDPATKVWKGDQLWKTGNRQIKVTLRRKAPKFIQDGIRELLRNIQPFHCPKPPKPSKSDRHMAEISLYDHHFGKLAWGAETGTPYDLEIAEQDWSEAIVGMIERIHDFNIEKIVLPLGNDFFHSDSFDSKTSNDTRVDSVDDRFSKVFRVGCRSASFAIERCLEIAPVEIIFVPGNHDRHTAWYLTEVIASRFEGNKHVTIDNGPRERKYVSYGPSLNGYVHGDESKHSDLPTLMATEVPLLWSTAKFRSWRLGHWHKRKEVRHTVGDTFNGVEVRILPSLCGTDAWHFRKGYVGNHRMAEVHLFSATDGPVGYFLQHAKSAAL